MQDIFIGVDVSQERLDIAGTPGTLQLAIANGRREIKRWLKGVPVGAHVGMESTGAYHQCLAELARQAGMHVYVLNPKRVWYAARGEARRSTALQMSMKGVEGLDDEVKAMMKGLSGMREAIDQKIQALVAKDGELVRKSQLLLSVPAIGANAAAGLAALFSRIPFARSDSVIAYMGIDVRVSDSGKHRGRRRLTKMGPAHWRKQIWLMGFVGTHTKLYKPIYQALRAKGFKSTEAVMILGRRILRIAWGVWRTDKAFDPALLPKLA